MTSKRPHALLHAGQTETFLLISKGEATPVIRNPKLDRLLAATRSGEGKVLVIRGEAGVGKTALLGYLRAQASGCRVIQAIGVESEMELPFAGLHQLCAPMLDLVERLPVPQRNALATAFGQSDGDPPDRFLVALALFAGSWLSGYFIIATNAFMQHPVGFETAADGTMHVARLGEFLFNPWARAQYVHNQVASVVTASFVVAAVGAFWTLRGAHGEAARVTLRTGVLAGIVSSMLVMFPTGHEQGRLVAEHQPVTLAAMEGHFESGPRACRWRWRTRRSWSSASRRRATASPRPSTI